MDIRTAEDKTAVLEALLNEARIEANQLRQRLEFYRRVIASTRLVMGHEFRSRPPPSAVTSVSRRDVDKAGLRSARVHRQGAHRMRALN
jgi:hypothetical protein